MHQMSTDSINVQSDYKYSPLLATLSTSPCTSSTSSVLPSVLPSVQPLSHNVFKQCGIDPRHVQYKCAHASKLYAFAKDDLKVLHY
jgi:hypothetical protein